MTTRPSGAKTRLEAQIRQSSSRTPSGGIRDDFSAQRLAAVGAAVAMAVMIGLSAALAIALLASAGVSNL